MGTTDGFGIYKGTRYPEAAWEFMKFLISPRYGRAMSRAHLLQPARASLVDSWIADVREQYPEKAKEMDLGAFAARPSAGFQRDPRDLREPGRGAPACRQARGNRSSRSAGNRSRTCARFPAQIEAAQAAPAEGQGGGRVGAKGFWRRWRACHRRRRSPADAARPAGRRHLHLRLLPGGGGPVDRPARPPGRAADCGPPARRAGEAGGRAGAHWPGRRACISA